MLNESHSGPLAFVRRYRLLIIVVIVVLGGGAWFIHHAKQQNAANTRPQFNFRQTGVAVSVATVQQGDIVVRIPALGTVTPLTTVTIKPQVSGIMQEVAFKEGQMVKKGDFLALIDPRPYDAALAQARASLARDQAQLADAELNMQRYADLLKQDSIAQQTADTQRATVGQLEGTVESDKAQIKTAELNLAYTRISAPLTGRVGLRQVDPGNYVNIGDSLVVITQLQPISTLFSVPEDNINDIMKQLRGEALLSVEASDRSDSHLIATGHLSTTDNQIDATTGTLKLRALFDNADFSLFPGQFVNVNLVVNTLKGQTVMPTAAVRRGAPNGVQSAFVYLVNKDNTVTVRPVTLGQVDGERVVANSGVALNDVVVTDGGDRLRDGATVQLPEATAAEVAKARALKPKDEDLTAQDSAPGARGFPGNLTPEQRKRFEEFRKRRRNGNGNGNGGGLPGGGGFGGPPR